MRRGATRREGERSAIRRRLPLHLRLALALVALLLPLGAFCVWIAERGAQAYSVEVSQRLNAPIAMYMAENAALLDADGEPDTAALATLAEHVMMINPSVEVYVLDTAGNVVAQAEGANRIARPHVSLGPVERFLKGAATGEPTPSLGDDPLRPGESRPFSVHPLAHDGRTVGYVYAVIGAPGDRPLIDSVRSSYALSVLVAMFAAVLVTAALGGSLALVTLTRRLRRLTRRVEAWRDAEGSDRATGRPASGGDEIDALTSAYDAMTARLRAQYGALEDQERDRRELVANVSHDLRTPLTTLKGYLETLQLRRGRLALDVEHGYIDIAARHAARLERLVADLFELATLDSGERRPDPERFSMLELAHDALQDVEMRSAERGVRLSVRPPSCGTSELDACADIALVQRALENLLDNALRHVHRGGRIDVRLGRRDDRLIVAVDDDGTGMAPEVVERLFEPGFRARARDGGHDADGGRTHAGLGLAIVRGIVALHAGRIEVRSVPGGGSSFTFDLPAAEDGRGAEACPARDRSPAARHRAGAPIPPGGRRDREPTGFTVPRAPRRRSPPRESPP